MRTPIKGCCHQKNNFSRGTPDLNIRLVRTGAGFGFLQFLQIDRRLRSKLNQKNQLQGILVFLNQHLGYGNMESRCSDRLQGSLLNLLGKGRGMDTENESRSSANDMPKMKICYLWSK